MHRTILLAVAVGAVLTACAETRTFYTADTPRTKGFSLTLVAAPNPTAPNVFIVGDKIVVDQEPVRPPGTLQGDPITIYYALAEGGSYVFPEHGVEIKGHPDFCSPISGSKYVFRCAYSRPAPDTVYKYIIRVKNETTGTTLKDLDPTIWN